jgi:septal ring factor EnvC (AmiA/AmiB activator)
VASPVSPTAALLRSAQSELARIERAATRIQQRRAALLGQLAEMDEQAEEYARRKRLLEELAYVEHAAPTPTTGAPAQRPAKGAIKGRKLRRVAGHLLWSEQRDVEIHYREWFERVIAAGYAVGGKDPLASFLTNIRDSPAVRRGSAQGRYRLDPDSLEAIAQQIAETQAELADIERSIERTDATPDRRAIDGLRGHRDELKQTLKGLEAKMSELRYIFGNEAPRSDIELGRDETLRAA